MPGIISPLETDHHIGLPGQEINHLPLAFISPLGTHDNDTRHSFAPRHLFEFIRGFMLKGAKSQPVTGLLTGSIQADDS
jgi:hypothetical protein